MGLAILHSRAQLGVEAPPVTIEVLLSGGLPTFHVVGLAETAVRESKDRVRGAILSSGFRFPQERITVNLAPADMKKSGGRFDLPIALGILAAGRQIPATSLGEHEFYGELSLNGDLRALPGVLPAAIKAQTCGRALFVPPGNASEARLAGGEVASAKSLLDVTARLANGAVEIAESQHESVSTTAMPRDTDVPDLRDVRGQQAPKRALEIAAAGGHNLLLIGPPGTGKSMLAQRLPGILPPMNDEEALESASINSVLGLPLQLSSWRQRPFRAPHHTASAVSLVGGGSDPRPGEVSRAHNGVLFLDELPEFSRHVLEVLREPMESGRIAISRAKAQVDYPARFQLIAAMNPCPCGYLGDRQNDCGCSAEVVKRYRGKISGPLLDRIDLQIEVTRPPVELLRPDAPEGEPSHFVAERVNAARQRQYARSKRHNAALESSELGEVFNADSKGWALLERAAEKLPLSARAYQRVQRVALTIADMEASDKVQVKHIAEALTYRRQTNSV